ncbi:hypothetical protein LTV02_36715 [Nocardia yamanashiensis]|uniref:hypothetical protein n=1 Tax=Nocardia yamanashiensis TaxID=209247 RepID=UPI001E48696B|nr:hypothetical protein [Nocardia yamanashiensis]UGT41412.1 hypothetical protein LTV02_36715 [Nocardia yamanashiensis]
MIVGVPRETADGERRVALTPADVEHLAAQGIQVLVQQGAGWRADFTDAGYLRAGAVLLPDQDSVFAAADVVAWVKPPARELDSLPLRSGQVLMGFQDPVHRRGRLAELAARGVKSIAFEQLSRRPGTRDPDPLSAMSRIAGAVAYLEGRALLPFARETATRPESIHALGQRVSNDEGGSHEPRVGGQDVPPDGVGSPEAGESQLGRNASRALVIGAGQAGLAAVAAAVDEGDELPIVIGNRAAQRATALEAGADRFRLAPSADAVSEVIRRFTPDLVLCAAGQRGSAAPVLLDHAGLAALPVGAVVVDLTAKAGGNCVATVANATVRVANGVLVMHRSNFPAARPHLASRVYGAATAAQILGLAAAWRTVA